MKSEFGHFIAGFTAGEGCFHIFAGPRKGKPSVFNVTASFSIRLRSDDAYILHQIRAFLDVGYVLPTKVYRGSKEQTTYQVTKIRELAEVVIPFFRAFPLRARKATDFEIWSEAIELLWKIQQRPKRPTKRPKGRSSWTDEDRHRIMALSRALKECRKWENVQANLV